MVYQDPVAFFTYNSTSPTRVFPMTGGNTFGAHGFFCQSSVFPVASYGPPTAPPMIPSPEIAENPSWYIDSGATNHIINDSDKLLESTKYTGTKKLLVGNDIAINIQHVRSVLLATTSHELLVLNNVLHVPCITKNLLSVSKLIADDNVITEFLEHSCFVKARST